jgi:osmotically-inducible protein OsmY
MIVALAILVAAAPQAAREQLQQKIDDGTITASINGQYLVNKYLSPFNIKVNTRDGVVTLTGSVEDETQKAMAEELAASFHGVEQVINELVVVGTTTSEKQGRSLKQKLLDRKISAAVRSRLVANKEFQGLNIGVETVNNVVTLHGVVGTEVEKARIGQIAERGPDIERVHNFLTVRPKDDAGFVEGLGRQFSDEWIESRVSTAILLNRHISIRELDVEVDDGVCVLTGVVDSEAQRTLAAKLAESIRGVSKVQNDVRLRDRAPELEPLDADPEVGVER